ncbi:hypothetical protein J2Z21_004034 [Streptomyces griseochromogenes]|uniref:Uncharacterized protein n=1 Tax=Streptomyces griseochromogenes TaxID=68214 RepID=A0ABS4LUI7_9ACTN|nr:hypothetical protein [Streptomyces griseochromogenes]
MRAVSADGAQDATGGFGRVVTQSNGMRRAVVQAHG